jgi:hypothetical protein
MQIITEIFAPAWGLFLHHEKYSSDCVKHQQRDNRTEIHHANRRNYRPENIEIWISDLAQRFHERVTRIQRDPAHQYPDENQH